MKLPCPLKDWLILLLATRCAWADGLRGVNFDALYYSLAFGVLGFPLIGILFAKSKRRYQVGLGRAFFALSLGSFASLGASLALAWLVPWGNLDNLPPLFLLGGVAGCGLAYLCCWVPLGRLK